MIGDPTPLPFQARVVAQGVRLKRMPIKSPMGSGKTLMALWIYDKLELWKQSEPVIILARVNAQLTWLNHIHEYLADRVTKAQIGFARGKKTDRLIVWSERRKYKFILATYESFREDAKQELMPRGLNYILDEPHRYLKDHRKTTFKSVYERTWDSDVIIPVSGTFIKRGPEDLYSMLLLCNRKNNMFTSYWRYVQTWNHMIDGPFGKEIIGPKNVENYKERVLGQYTGWVTKEEAAKYMPQGARIRVPIELSGDQETLVEKIMTQTHIERHTGELILLPNAMTRILRYRQALVCPKILDERLGYGAALEEIGNRLDETDDPRPVIFTPFTESIPFIEQYIHDELGSMRPIFAFQGGLSLDELKTRVDRFQGSNDGIAICSVSYAESFEFVKSGEGFFLGYSWSWVDNVQAEGRMTRLISENRNPRFFYVIHYGHIDERMFDVLNSDAARAQAVTPESLMEMYVKLRTQKA